MTIYSPKKGQEIKVTQRGKEVIFENLTKQLFSNNSHIITRNTGTDYGFLYRLNKKYNLGIIFD